MGFKEGMCPKCHELLQVPEDRERILCMFCGQEIETAEAVRALAEHNRIVAESVPCMDIYGEVKEDFLSMLEKIEDPMKGFKKQTYETTFQDYYNRNRYIFEALEKAYCVAEDKEAFLAQAAADFVCRAQEGMSAITKKSQRADQQLKNNMAMVVYILPAIAAYKGSSSQALPEQMVALWNETFENTNIKTSTFELINAGFKRRFCYITTAVCESLGKPDDCYELNLLRDYRDGYLMERPEGEALVQEYYDIAPTIVKRIGRRSDAGTIYQGIYDQYLKPCIRLIEEGDQAACQQVYTDMVQTLKETYFLTERVKSHRERQAS